MIEYAHFSNISAQTPYNKIYDCSKLYPYEVAYGGDLSVYHNYFSHNGSLVSFFKEQGIFSFCWNSGSFLSGISINKTPFLQIALPGYRPFLRIAELVRLNTDLPYINGCSTREIFPPIRVGDPTLQMLKIPPYTSEQAHHIHSTTRIVYVASGTGVSVIGQKGKSKELILKEDDLLILDPMVPHHFFTKDSTLVVFPFHMFSTPVKNEYDHPMRAGTFEV